MSIKFFFKTIVVIVLFPFLCSAQEYPDVGGVLDFSKPENISNRLFILTNPKSGSHLLLYSIMKITKRPLRGRVPFWHFENDPPFFVPENMMNYPLDFSKPTTYWGHEYSILSHLNRNQNKLLFILRNYKETISSQLLLSKKGRDDLESLFLDEILNEGQIFKEYILRLQLFDQWDCNHKHLVLFEDLIQNPQTFVPQVMLFIGDDSEYNSFIEHYDDFKEELMKRYAKKGNSTGSKSDLFYFSKKISPQVLKATDDYVSKYYPYLWQRYLNRFAEPDRSAFDLQY